MVDDGGLTKKLTQDEFVTEKIDVIKNNLLGSYDDEGNYFLSRPVIEELLKLYKLKKSSFGNSIFCIGTLLGYGEIVFEVAFNKKTNDGKNAKATLYVLEGVDKINGYLQNTIKTKLAEYVSDVSNFVEEAYKYFRITLKQIDDSDDESDEGRERKIVDDEKLDASFILAKMQFSRLLDKLLDDKFLDAYGKYFSFRLSALTKLNNEFSNTILDSFNSQYKLIENTFLQEKNYKMLNELLDKCIEEVSGTNEKFVDQEKEFNEKTKPALDAFIENYNKLSGKFETKALNMMDKSDRVKVQEIIDKDAKVANEAPVQDYENMRESVEEVVKGEKEQEKKTDKLVSQLAQDVEQKQQKANVQENEEKSKEEPKPEEKTTSIVEKYISSNKQEHTGSGQVVESEDTNSAQQLIDRLSRIGKYKQQENEKEPNEQEQEQKSNEKMTKSGAKMENIFDFFSQKKSELDDQLSKNLSNRYDEFNQASAESEMDDISDYMRQKKNKDNPFNQKDFGRDM